MEPTMRGRHFIARQRAAFGLLSLLVLSVAACGPEQPANEDLFRVPVAGGNAEQLTFGLAYDFDPVYSRDGRRLEEAQDSPSGVRDARGGAGRYL
jgi:hypothetical protein